MSCCITSFFFQDDSGHINFREYLIGLALVSQPANSEEVMQLAFQVRNYTGHCRGGDMSGNFQGKIVFQVREKSGIFILSREKLTL